MKKAQNMRRGYNLIEMIVVMTIGTVLMGIGVTLLAVLLKAEQNGRSHVEHNASLARLDDQFRGDVHAAAVRPAADQKQLGVWQWTLADGHAVKYACKPGVVDREEWDENKIIGRDSFYLPKDASATIAVEAKGAAACVRLVVILAEPPAADGREIRIEALLGRDRRLMHDDKSEKADSKKTESEKVESEKADSKKIESKK
jgi:prepilin-type N-terminal cleavage/methylation domain-containing protein